jgi:hypothetical protein
MTLSIFSEQFDSITKEDATACRLKKRHCGRLCSNDYQPKGLAQNGLAKAHFPVSRMSYQKQLVDN